MVTANSQTPSKKKVKKDVSGETPKTPAPAAVSAKKSKESSSSSDKDLQPQIDPRTFVPTSKLTESIDVLRKLEDIHSKANESKKALFEADNKMVHLQIDLKKIPANFSTFIHSVALPYHWRRAVDCETCLIVPDVNKEPLTDRDLDIEQTKGKIFDILEAASASELIKDILPTRQLRNEFRNVTLKSKLGAEYGAFLCDRRLLRNKYDFLSRFLGKAFWIEQKKVPIAVDLQLPASELRGAIESALNQTQIYISGKGASLSVIVGSLEQDGKHLLANLESILQKLKTDIFPNNNVRALTLKTQRSESVTFYMDLGPASEVKLLLDPKLTGQQQSKEPGYVEDDFDFLTNSRVRVYKSGKIQILPGKKRKTPEEDGADNSVDKPEVAGPEETKLIRGVNRFFNSDGSDWARHKVSHMKKARKLVRSSKLPGTKGGKRFFKKGKTTPKVQN